MVNSVLPVLSTSEKLRGVGCGVLRLRRLQPGKGAVAALAVIAVFLLIPQHSQAECPTNLCTNANGVLTWKIGSEPNASQELVIPSSYNCDYRYHIDWGDGRAEDVPTAEGAPVPTVTHRYPRSGYRYLLVPTLVGESRLAAHDAALGLPPSPCAVWDLTTSVYYPSAKRDRACALAKKRNRKALHLWVVAKRRLKRLEVSRRPGRQKRRQLKMRQRRKAKAHRQYRAANRKLRHICFIPEYGH
jgi:hypothetical protein